MVIAGCTWYSMKNYFCVYVLECEKRVHTIRGGIISNGKKQEIFILNAKAKNVAKDFLKVSYKFNCIMYILTP